MTYEQQIALRWLKIKYKEDRSIINLAQDLNNRGFSDKALFEILAEFGKWGLKQ